MVKVPELVEMLKMGVHFGHQSSKRYPKMGEYVHTTRNQIDVIDLEKTARDLKTALDFINKVASTGGVILFVSSKKQAKEIVKKHALDCGMPFINSRWLGGTFTNFANISKLTRKLKSLEEKARSGELEKYTKKERVDFDKEITRLNDLVGGIKELNRLPEAMFVVDVKKDESAVYEANKKKVPVIAMVDTNDNPKMVQYPVGANNDAVKSIELITGLVAQTIKEVRKS